MEILEKGKSETTGKGRRTGTKGGGVGKCS